jgi:hypothetical protein
MYNILRAWRQTHQLDIDDPRGEAPIFVSSPMIMMKKLIPHQRANTRDPEIRNLAFKGGEGSYVFQIKYYYRNKRLWKDGSSRGFRTAYQHIRLGQRTESKPVLQMVRL